MNEINKYKKTIQGTSNRHMDVSTIINKGKVRNEQISMRRIQGDNSMSQYHPRHLPPLPDNYFGSQIDEVSSARDSIIENESQINIYRDKSKM